MPGRRWARESVAAVMFDFSLDTANPEDVRFLALPLGESQDLCPGEAFADQLSVAVCTATVRPVALSLTPS